MRRLQRITVVALGQAVAAPFATRQLADLGARIIKIERPGGGDFACGYDQRVRGLSSHFVWTNRSKQSLTLDLKQPAALQVLLQLIRDKADVLVLNLAPGAATRLGLGYEALSAAQPGLVVCDIPDYGVDARRSGPCCDKKAYDLLIQSEAGLVSVTGTPDAPSKAGASMADIAAGMYAYSGLLAALLQRQRDGRGPRASRCRCSNRWANGWDSRCTAPSMAPSPPPRSGASQATIYPYGPFPAGDGKTVMLGLQNERKWAAFCEQTLLQPELGRDARVHDNARRSARPCAR